MDYLAKLVGEEVFVAERQIPLPHPLPMER
jgi:hypothetical protein